MKWFEPEKGYGFISPDGGGKDVFIHITALRRSGVNALGPGQRVRVDVVDGKKGLEADRITLILRACDAGARRRRLALRRRGCCELRRIGRSPTGLQADRRGQRDGCGRPLRSRR